MYSWETHLLSEIDNCNVNENEVVLWSLGGAGFVLKTNKTTIYLDPYFGPSVSEEWIRMIPIPIDPNEIRQVDAVIMTHEHDDHCDRNTIVPIRKNTKAIFVGPPRATERALTWNASPENVVAMKPYQEITVGDVRVTAFPSKDPNPGVDALMYHVQAGKVDIVHSGDTSYFQGFREISEKYPVDIALLNLGHNAPQWTTRQYMSYCDVVQAASDLRAKIVIPMHWDIWKVALEDPFLLKPLMASHNPKIDVVVLRVGDRFEYSANKHQTS